MIDVDENISMHATRRPNQQWWGFRRWGGDRWVGAMF